MTKTLFFLWVSIGLALANSAYSTTHPFEELKKDIESVIVEAGKFITVPNVGGFKEDTDTAQQQSAIKEFQKKEEDLQNQIDELGYNLGGLMLETPEDAPQAATLNKLQSTLAQTTLLRENTENNLSTTWLLANEDKKFDQVCQNAFILRPLGKLMAWFIRREEVFEGFIPPSYATSNEQEVELENAYNSFYYPWSASWSTLVLISRISTDTRGKLVINPSALEKHLPSIAPGYASVMAKFEEIMREFLNYDITKVPVFFKNVKEIYGNLKYKQRHLILKLENAQKKRNKSLKQLAAMRKAQAEGKPLPVPSLDFANELGNALGLIQTKNNIVKVEVNDPKKAEKYVHLKYLNKSNELFQDLAITREKLSVVSKLKEIIDEILAHLKKNCYMT